jgi:hypothetical protein
MKGAVFPVVARKGTIRIMRVVSLLIARRSARFTLSIPVNLALKEGVSPSDDIFDSCFFEVPDRLRFLSSAYPTRKILATGLPCSCLALENALERFLLFQKKSMNSADSANAFLI